MALMFMPASWAGAQEWAKVMFDATSHDFGTIAQGKKVEHRFTIENKYDEDVHIASVSSGCGCVTQKIDKQLLKPHEKSGTRGRVAMAKRFTMVCHWLCQCLAG
jgi:hypothetical protein